MGYRRGIVSVVVTCVVAACSPLSGTAGRSSRSSAPTSASSPAIPAAPQALPFATRLPLLADLPDMASLVYRVPADRGLFANNGRWEGCGQYPEVGNLSADEIQGEYDSPATVHGDWPLFFVRLRQALPGEDVGAEMSAWVQRCDAQFSVGGQDYATKLESSNPHMPAGTTLLTVTNTKHRGVSGESFFGPPGVQIAVAESGGVTFQAWAQFDPRDGDKFERQLGAMARSFQRSTTPAAGKPVAQWSRLSCHDCS